MIDDQVMKRDYHPKGWLQQLEVLLKLWMTSLY